MRKKMTEETKKKISEARIGITAWNKGLAPSNETRRKMRGAHLGKKLSEEHRGKLVSHLRTLWEAKRGTKLEGTALENARAGMKICQKKSLIVRAKTQHCLSDVDLENLRAVCSLCGKVPISRDTGGHKGFQCRLASKKISVAYPGQALTMWNEQQGLCAVCHLPMKLSGIASDSVCADHDHETKLLRGFLHNNCNRGIGYFNDDPVKLRQAAEYLERIGAIHVQTKTS